MFVYRVGQRQIDVVKYVKHRVGSCVIIYYCVVFHVNNGTYFCPILYMIFRDICRHIMFETFMRVSLCMHFLNSSGSIVIGMFGVHVSNQLHR